MMTLSNINKSYKSAAGKESVLGGLDFHIGEGEYVAIMGSSGTGKSTLMNILGTLERPDDGEYMFRGKAIHKMSNRKLTLMRNKEIGFVFQNYQLIPNLSIYQNVMLPLEYRRKWFMNKRDRVRKALAMVGLEGKLRQKPYQLSGGQKQRVAIARAIVNEPSLLLADEPTGSLDEKTTESILEIFDDLHQRGVTIIMITHDLEVAKRAERTVYLKGGLLKEHTYETSQSL
ncbi:ATP-binding cassette domain-containing protein [Oceanobacillus sp. 143]|uniref:Macrolide ABC transporter ATP-binding protein n=1 Tax=Oceanobacillus zhaokaii TaxID=2052660 RepID=A0A345PLP7_9BACI|nr:ABC transporter ATP-binding protein [Oceanobacillus zhaokaii]AXI10927.1 macrolide ABC transporter ATP-binding protein [Oceanobacillus zhaokaii]QGS69763.1 ATP-binding cassette domain-containing protein [Oceanobacillus sp. 143]